MGVVLDGYSLIFFKKSTSKRLSLDFCRARLYKEDGESVSRFHRQLSFYFFNIFPNALVGGSETGSVTFVKEA